MSKYYKPLLALTVLTIAVAAVIVFSLWDYDVSSSLPAPPGSIGTYDSSNKYHKDQLPAVSPERRPAAAQKRVNILLLGIEGKARSDTIIFISYDKLLCKLSLISIPRDTYFYEDGFNHGDQRKINAVYGRKKEKGCVDAVAALLCTPIDYYISVDYEGVERIIDAIQGVEIEVPLEMEAGGIRIAKGKQVLYGKEALQYLRFRKKYPDGDLGRIKAQQRLIKAALKKVQYTALPGVVEEAFKSIRTNMSLKQMAEYAMLLRNDEIREVQIYTLPGTPMYRRIGGFNWSYFFHNPQKVSELVQKIYAAESREEKKSKRFEEY